MSGFDKEREEATYVKGERAALFTEPGPGVLPSEHFRANKLHQHYDEAVKNVNQFNPQTMSVAEASGALANMITELDAALGDLFEKLSPALREPESVEPTPDTPARDSDSELQKVIWQHYRRVEQLAGATRYITKRIDL